MRRKKGRLKVYVLLLVLFESSNCYDHKDVERSSSSSWSSNIKDAFGSFATKMEEAGNKLPSIRDVTQNLPSPSQIKEAVNKMPAQLKEAAEELHSQIKDATKDLPSQIKQATGNIGSQIKKATVKLPSQIKKAAAKLPSQMKNAAIQLPSQMKEAANKIDSQLDDVIEKIAPDIDVCTKKKLVYGVAGAGAALGTATVALPALGFTAAGVAAGSVAAGVQAVVGGAGVAGTVFGALQSAGAAGMAGGTKALLSAAGAYAAQKFTDCDLNGSTCGNEDTATENVLQEGDEDTQVKVDGSSGGITDEHASAVNSPHSSGSVVSEDGLHTDSGVYEERVV